MSIDIRLLGKQDSHVIERVGLNVFDHPVCERWCKEFFTDARHHLVVAVEHELVVGIVSAVHYVHPDKAPQLWINELGVASTHRRQGIARQMMMRMLDHGRSLGCTEAWLGTEESNVAARTLYESLDETEPAEPFILYTFNLAT